MNKLLSFLFNKAFYIGFFLSASLAMVASQLSTQSIEELKTAIQHENSIRVVLRLNYLIQRSLSTASTAMVLDEPSVFAEGLKVYKSGLNLLESNKDKVDPILYDNLINGLREMELKFKDYSEAFSKGFKPTDKQFSVFAITLERVAMNLARVELEGWKNSAENYSQLMGTQKRANFILKIVHFLLTIFLIQLMLVSRVKEKAKVKLKKSEVLHKTLFKSLNEAVILCRADGIIYSCNDAAIFLMGIEKSSIIGRRIMGILPHLMREDQKLFEKSQNPIYKAINEKEVVINKTVGFLTPSYNSKWVNLSVSPMFIEEENEASWILSLSDITDRVKAEKLILEQQQSIISSSKMSALGQMAGGIAHEINNPLAIIHAEAEEIIDIIEDDGDIEGDLARSMAENIGKTVQRIAKIVRGLKTFSRDASEDPFVPTNVGSIIESVLGLVAQKLKNNEIDLEVQDFDPDTSIECRETQICQVIVNLIGNSLDAMEENNIKDKFLKLEVLDLGNEVEMAIIDAGHGIPKAIQEKMLQPFFTTKEVGKGTGLGLSISRGIMDKHKGSLFIDNKTKNTRIAIRLPKKHRQETSSDTERAA